MRGKILSMSATVIMMGTMLLTGQADIQSDYQEEIHTVTFEKIPEAADVPLETAAPDGGVVERTHNVHVYTQEDAALMKRVSLAEGQTEGPDGMFLILSVIANRVSDPDWPQTVSGVVYQPNAFASIKDGNFDKAPETTPECEEAFARIEAGEVCPEIVAFETVDSNVLDQWFSEAFTYRHHKFYTKKR